MDNQGTGSSKGKRGRRRDDQEGDLSEDEQKRRQKNRDAAKKCRLNKLKEVEDLKMSNKNLEDQNTDLLKKKCYLEDKVKQLLEFIQDHITKGCKLPTEQSNLLHQKTKDFNELKGVDFAGSEMSLHRTDQAVSPEAMEGNSHMVYSPQSNQTAFSPSSSFDNSPNNSDNSPITLFTGQPVTLEQAKRRSSSTRTSSIQSPISPRSPSSVNGVYFQQGTAVALKDVLVQSNGIPSSGPLAPIKPSYSPQRYSPMGTYRQDSTQLERQTSSESSASSIPLVVHALEEEGMEEADQGLGHQNGVQVVHNLQQPKEECDMEVECPIPRFESSLSEAVGRNTDPGMPTNNLGSGGFVIRQEGQMGSDMPQTVPSYTKLQPTGKKCDDLSQLNVTAPELIAQAILNIPDSQMSTSLKQQIHSYSSSSLSNEGNTTSEQEKQTSSIGESQVHQQVVYASSHGQQASPSEVASPQQVTEIYVNPQQPAGHEQPSHAHLPSQSHDRSENEQRTSTFPGPIFKNIKYVQKRGHHFVLDELPNGKHRVYEIKENNTLVDTAYEVTLKDSPAASAPQPPTREETPSPAHVVPQNNESGISSQFQQVHVTDGMATSAYQSHVASPVNNSQQVHVHDNTTNVTYYQQVSDPTHACSISHYQEVVETTTEASSFPDSSHLANPTATSIEQTYLPKTEGAYVDLSNSKPVYSASQENGDNSSSGSGLTSLNLPSLTFHDFTREDIDVYSKKPKKKE